MHEQLANALRPILRDAATSRVPCPAVVDEDWIDSPDMASAMLAGGTGISVRLNAPESDQVAAVANQVQEWIIEELWGSAPTNWPPCPLHSAAHPLEAVAIAGTANWSCPTDQLPITPVGALRN